MGLSRRQQKTTPHSTPKNKISRSKGQSSRRTAFVREITREVVGLAPYERRIIELLRNTQDKRARKLAKKRVRCYSYPVVWRMSCCLLALDRIRLSAGIWMVLVLCLTD